MAWTFRSFLGKWKPTARFVVGCLLKVAGGTAAAVDPDNELVYKCLAAGSEQAAEHVFDSLSSEQVERLRRKRKGWDQLGYYGLLRKVYEEYPSYRSKSKIAAEILPTTKLV